MRPLQVSYIAILMLLLFGTFILTESGKFILPLGIYKPLFAVTVFIDFFLIKQKRSFVPLLAGAIFLLFTSKFVLELFMSEDALYAFQLSGFTDIALLLFLVCLLIWSVVEALKAKDAKSWIFLIGNTCFAACLLFNTEEYAALGLLLSALAFYRDEARENTFAVSLLLFFLAGSATITGMVYGKMSILANL